MPADRRVFLAASALSAISYNRVLGSNERVGLGFIGYGLMGKGHVATFKAFDDVNLVAVADVHRGRMAEGRDALGKQAHGYSDFRELLENKDVHAVVIATPDHWHALAAMMACAAGRDVYVEKPLTLFPKEGRWLIDVAAKHKRVVQVGTQQRSGPHYQRARDLIRGGHIGQLVSVRMMNTRNIAPGFRSPRDSDPPKELDWDLWLGPAPKCKYNVNRGLYHFRWHWDYSGGQMTNLGAHHLDIVDWIIGLETLKNVTAIGSRHILTDNGETPDTQDALFAFEKYSASFTMRECAAGPKPEFNLEFIGVDGTLGLSRKGFAVSPEANVPAANQVPGVKDGHPVGGPRPVEPPKEQIPRTAAMADASGDSAEQYRLHARNFLDCIRSRGTPISDLGSAHRVATACHLANISTRLGRSLKWDAKTETIVGDEEAIKMLVRAYRSPWDRELKVLGVK